MSNKEKIRNVIVIAECIALFFMIMAIFAHSNTWCIAYCSIVAALSAILVVLGLIIKDKKLVIMFSIWTAMWLFNIYSHLFL